MKTSSSIENSWQRRREIISISWQQQRCEHGTLASAAARINNVSINNGIKSVMKPHRYLARKRNVSMAISSHIIAAA